MRKISRRSFLHQGTIAAGAVAFISQLPKQLFAHAAVLDIPLGFQTWSVKEELAKDFKGTLKKMISIERGIVVLLFVKSEIPITPPSTNLPGIRNPFKPNPAEATPIRIKAISRNCIFSLFFSLLAARLRRRFSIVRLLSSENRSRNLERIFLVVFFNTDVRFSIVFQIY